MASSIGTGPEDVTSNEPTCCTNVATVDTTRKVRFVDVFRIFIPIVEQQVRRRKNGVVRKQTKPPVDSESSGDKEDLPYKEIRWMDLDRLRTMKGDLKFRFEFEDFTLQLSLQQIYEYS